MAFVDHITIRAEAGRGGNGVVRWLRAKSNARGGPNGGDGGKGGDVILTGVPDLAALARYRHEKEFHASDGKAGEDNLRHGADGDDLKLVVPIGTLVRVVQTGEEYEITREGAEVRLFKGGRGGRGNAHFKSSTNQNPFEHTNGTSGGGGDIDLSLKIIADVGFIGLPSAGKSSLLNALTRARAKVGAYPFTTLEPNLGDFYGFILADIPGLIEGASAGKGLGIKFLKHIERTGFLVHLISVDQDDPIKAYKDIRRELAAFGNGLAEKKEVIVLSKTDLVSQDAIKMKMQALVEMSGRDVYPVSIEDPEKLKSFSDTLANLLRE